MTQGHMTNDKNEVTKQVSDYELKIVLVPELGEYSTTLRPDVDSSRASRFPFIVQSIQRFRIYAPHTYHDSCRHSAPHEIRA